MLLRGTFILEVRDPNSEALFVGDGSSSWLYTASLGCYPLDGGYWLVGLGYPDGARVAQWRPRWGAALPEGSDDVSFWGGDREEHDTWAAEAIRFVVVLGLLLDAAQTPLATTEEGPRLAGQSKGVSYPARPWSVRRIYLEGVAAKRRSAGAPEGSSVDGREAAEVRVRGHLKRQPHGPGNSLRRWVYVDGYEARRWVAPRPLKVVVGKRSN